MADQLLRRPAHHRVHSPQFTGGEGGRGQAANAPPVLPIHRQQIAVPEGVQRAEVHPVEKMGEIGGQHLADQPVVGNGQPGGGADVGAVALSVGVGPLYLQLAEGVQEDLVAVAKEWPGPGTGNAPGGPVAVPAAVEKIANDKLIEKVNLVMNT